MNKPVLKLTKEFATVQNSPIASKKKLKITPVGMALGLALSLSFVLCVLFDLWFPDFAMYPAWASLLPGFVWISWSSFFIGLLESFAYGWYAALLFIPLYNFFNHSSSRAN